MSWDWKSGLKKLFGGNGPAPTTDAPPPAQKLSPEAAAVQEGIDKGTHREYSAGELAEIVECMRQLKDITQVNMLAMQCLAAATPKTDNPDIQGMREALQTLAGQPFENAQNALVELNANANVLEGVQARVAKKPAPALDNRHLPVYDAQRKLVIGIAQQAQAVYKAHNALSQQVRESERFLDIPELDRVKAGLKESEQTLGPLVIKLCRITTETVGSDAPKKPREGYVPFVA
ncbi:MAG: hypothetical protein HYS17_10770 [Micavibrio aeruginosavorus]|uniref:Uncharacterized protein n=1 Tax=Micavibrio aeruginosavorus TaxID=349221 RepID=A0A7T5R1W9_9BACT|nr:MAG: hypothetical protein HYS17_10770 [Micavibrio aeruginosavorus]